MNMATIGLDLAKNVFQVHGLNRHGKIMIRKALPRAKVVEYFAQLSPCVVGMEACASAHYWGRTLEKLGHTVRLMAGQFVKPYRKNGKNDANDAEAICEAVSRPNMRFVPIKSTEQQSALMLHRIRSLAVRERTALVNQMRGLFGEFGVVLQPSLTRFRRGISAILEDAENGIPMPARHLFADLYDRFQQLDAKINDYDKKIELMATQSEAAQRLRKLGGVGAKIATAIIASVGDAKLFKNGRQFVAWLGLVPRQHSSGGKARLGHINKRGDAYLRTLLIHGARAVLRVADKRKDPQTQWAMQVRERRGNNIAAVALAAKLARTIWAMLSKGTEYRVAAI